MAQTINSDVHVANGTSYTLNGETYLNEATIYLDASGNLTDLLINGGVILAGSGVGAVTLSDSPNNRIFSNTSGSVLTNQNNLISGAGVIFSNSGLTLINGDDGVIDGNAQANALFVRDIGVTNTGTLQSTGDGGLTIQNATVANAGGLILAVGNSIAARVAAAAAVVSGSGHVDLVGSIITGGDLTTINNGEIRASGGTLLDSVHVTSGSQVLVDNAAAARITGTIDNEGRILLNAGGNLTDLVVEGAASLTGGGIVTLSGDNARIFSNTSGSTLTNVDNTIAGVGGQLFSNAGLTVTNETGGTIEADGGTFSINNIQVTNAGLMQAGSNATLQLGAMTLIDDGGTVEATSSGGTVVLRGSTIQGGTFETASGGAIVADQGTLLDGTGDHPIHITSGSQIEIRNAQDARIAGVLDNAGTLAITAAGNLTTLVVQGAVSLQGGGTVQITGDNAQVYSNSSGSTLSNVDNLVTGSGAVFSNAGLTLTNETGGTIRADGGTLLIRDIAVTNHGIMESGADATLLLRGATLTNDSVLRSIESAGDVTIRGSTISGGSLTTANGGHMSFDSGAVLDGTASHAVTITAGSELELRNAQTGTLTGVLTNLGTLSLKATGNLTDLIIRDTASFEGGGTVTLGSDNARIYSNSAGAVLSNVDNTIVGIGQILSSSGLSFVNEADGIVRADDGQLNIHDITATNHGIFEASPDGTLLLSAMTLVNGDGIVRSVEGGEVVLRNSSIQGGSLTTANGGHISFDQTTTIDGTNGHAVTITAGSRLELRNSQTGTIAGTIDNKGALAVAAAGNLTDLIVAGAVTLQGGGTLAMTSDNARIYSNSSGSSLSNLNNTISGSGQILSGSGLSFVNEVAGKVRADDGQFNIHDITATNHGTMEASTDGTLLFSAMTLVNDGVVRAIEAGGEVVLRNSSIQGGSLTTAGGGHMSFDQGTTIDGRGGHAVTITAGSELELRNSQTATITGVIDNKGTLSVAAAGNLTDLIVSGATTLQGGGRFEMTSANARVYSNSSGSTLTNADNTIVGSGEIVSSSGLSLTNQAGGTVRAEGGTLSLNLPVSNAGTFSAAASSVLNVTGLSNLSAGTLSGGSYIVESGGAIRLLGASSGIVTLDANAALGTGSFLGTQVGGADLAIEQTLTTVTLGHSLSLFAHNATWANAVTVQGSLNLNNDTYGSAAGLTIAGGGGAGGFGTFNTSLVDNGFIIALGGTLTFAQAVTGTGGITVGSMSTARVSASLGAAITVSFDGAVDANFETLRIDQAGTFAGKIALLQTDDRIDLSGIAATSAVISGGDLLVKNGTTTVATLHLNGDYSGRTFNVASDGAGGTFVTVNPVPTNTAPTAQNDAFSTNEDSGVTFDVRGNDSDAQTAAADLNAFVVGQPLHGSVVKNGNGTFTYTPAANYNGADSFTYRVSDGDLTSNLATVTLSVNAVNDAPTSLADSYTTTNRTTLEIAGPGLLANDSDIEGQALTVASFTDAAHGTVSVLPGGGFRYVPDGAFVGTDSFTYRARDASGALGAPATVQIQVAQQNTAPVAKGGDGAFDLPYYPATPGTTVNYNGPTGSLTRNDFDPDGDTFSAQLVEGPYFYQPDGTKVQDGNASVAVGADGSVSIQVNAYNFGTDYFTYRIVDSHGLASAPVEVKIDIGALPPPPPPPGGGGDTPVDPTGPDNPDNPNNPDNPDNPNNPNNPDSPQNPDNPDDPNRPDIDGPNGPGNNNNGPGPIGGEPPVPPGPGGTNGGAWGDVHATTFDGLNYDFQAAGEFVAARSTAGNDAEVQIRTKGYGGSVSLTTAIAASFDGHTVSYDGDTNVLRVDGAVVTFSLDSGRLDMDVGSNGAKLYQVGSEFLFAAPGNEEVLRFTDRGSYLDFNLGLAGARAAQFEGLLGDANGSSANDIALPDGTVLTSPLTYEQLYDQFGDSWRISDATSLFTYPAGKGTADFTDLDFPANPTRLADLPADVVAAAAAIVDAAGITDPALREDAIYDLALTGDLHTIRSGQTQGGQGSTLDVQPAAPVLLVGIGSTTPFQYEGNTGTTPFEFTIYRTSEAGSLVVNWSIGTTGFNIVNRANNADFAPGQAGTGSVTFAAGETQKTISVLVQGDGTAELNEQFSVAISLPTNPSGYQIVAPAVGATIRDDDVVAPTSSGDAYSTREGQTLSGSLLDNDTAPNGVALKAALASLPTHGELAFNDDGTFRFTPDAGFLGTDTFTYRSYDGFALGNLANVSLSVVAFAHLAIAATTASKAEGDSGTTAFTFTVSRSGDTSGASSATYTVAGSGTDPAAASDFTGGLATGTVTFAAGDTTKTITVNVSGDTAIEANEGFTVTLSAPSDGAVIDTASASATIVNDDAVTGGPDTLVVFVSEDFYNGDARFIVKVDGIQVGAVQTATTLHGNGYQPITLKGDFGAFPESVSVQFINDAYGGSPGTDRNLYVDKITLNGRVYEAEQAANTAGKTFATEAMLGGSKGALTFDVSPDTLVVYVSEDAYNGNARFIVKVDGVQVGDVQTATTLHGNGYQPITLHGYFGEGPESVSVQFINDAYGGTAAMDRNLYVDKITLNDRIFQAEEAINTAGPNFATEAMLGGSKGALTFDVTPDQLVVFVSEDAYNGNAQFLVKVDGVQVGGVQTATTLHGDGYQPVTIEGDFGSNPQNVSIQFVNDAYGGSAADRNLYVDKIALNGHVFEAEDAVNTAGPTSSTEAQLAGNRGALTFDVRPDTLVLYVAEDFYQGDARFVVKVDGTQVDGVQIASTHHGNGYQAITLQGFFGPDPEQVSVQFTNDLYGGNPDADRNLYVDKIELNGRAYEAEQATNTAGKTFATEAMLASSKGALTFDINRDTLVFSVAEDAYNGHAQFVVMVDGVEVGGLQTVTKAHGTGYQDIAIDTHLAASAQSLSIKFVNDLYGGNAGADRNLYVDKVTINGHVQEAETAATNTAGPISAAEAALFNSTGALTFDHFIF